MGESKRQLKVSRQIQKDLSEILRVKFSNIFRNALLTITRVSMSPDLSIARVYVSVLATGKVENVEDQLNQHKSEIRRELGNRIGKQVRIVPDLVFFEDHGSEHAQNIDDLLSGLDIPPQSEQS